VIEQGVVEKITRESTIVRIYQSGDCGDCKLCESGGKPDERIIRAVNEVAAGIGDWVEVNIAPQAVIQSALIIFVLPVFALILGYMLAHYIDVQSEILKIALGISAFFATFSIIRVYDRVNATKKAFKPAITRIIQKAT
jgi:sigma-E factor negative regulatory protein RseC